MTLPQHFRHHGWRTEAVEGKPFIVSETNHLVPKFEREGIPLVSSYAALQDWDGLLFYTFEHEERGV